MARQRRAVVLGAAGFIGSHLVRPLPRRGVAAWSASTTSSPARRRNLAHLARRAALRASSRQDICEPFDWSRARSTAVLDFASPASPDRLPGAPVRDPARRLARRRERARAGAAHGARSSSSPPPPRSTAIRSSTRSRRATGATSTRSGRARSTTRPSASPRPSPWPTGATARWTTRIARIFNTYGPRMRLDDGRVVPAFVAQALRGEPTHRLRRRHADPQLLLRGRQRGGDLAARCAPTCADPVNIGNPHEMTILDFAEAVQRHGRLACRIEHRAAPGGRPARAEAGHHPGPGGAGLGAEGRLRGGHAPDHRLVPRARSGRPSGAERILVTGGAGFIGSTIADLFLDAGWDVAVLDDLSTGKRENVPAGARFYPCDVRSAAGAEVVEKERPDVMCHQAAQIDVRRSMADPRFDADVNVGGLLNLMQAAVKAGSVRAGAVRLDRRGHLRRHRPHPDARGPPGAAGLPLRRVQGGERALPRRLPGAATASPSRPCATPTCTGRGRTRTGRRAWWPSSAGACSTGSRAPSTATAGRRATTSSWATSPGPTCSPPRSGFDGPLNVGTGIETDVNRLYGLLARAAGSTAPPAHGPSKPGEQRRSCVDPSAAAPGPGLAARRWRSRTASPGRSSGSGRGAAASGGSRLRGPPPAQALPCAGAAVPPGCGAPYRTGAGPLDFTYSQRATAQPTRTRADRTIQLCSHP